MVSAITYLNPLLDEMALQWPHNRCINVVCHGHSVPAGFFATPFVNTFDAYPHLLHRMIKERFPFATVNVIVTAIGGETSQRGAAHASSRRMVSSSKDSFCHISVELTAVDGR
jgi:hypothetical protein